MDETATRRKKIDPKLYAVGWEQVPGSEILTEQSAYEIAPGRIDKVKRGKPKKADYILEYRGKKLAIIEAKRDEVDVSMGVEQAKLYAEMLQIRFTYACNGDRIWAIDMGVKDARGNYIIPSTEGEVDHFPSPQELWAMTYPDKNEWRDKFNLTGFNRDGGREPRYYQEIAITNVLNAVAKQQKRILLTMATGTGKTYTAFQICWKLYQTKWNKDGMDRRPRILFIADRNVLANQASNDFSNFNEDLMTRITPKSLHKAKNRVPKGANIFFTIFQTMMSTPGDMAKQEGVTILETSKDSEVPFFMQYDPDFFDFIIIDECHRGGANDESEWRRLMDYFDKAYQLGMTATPRRKVNANTYNYFGDPVYSYSLKQGISDGYLVPFRVKISKSNADDYKYSAEDEVKGEIDVNKTYTEDDFYAGRIEMRDRDEHRVEELLKQIDPDEKTIIFCITQKHAMIVRDMINKHKRRPDSNYCMRVTADDGDKGEEVLRAFQNNEKLRPTILTTSYKLSTGVDARNVRNIVLMRKINNMVEFKQIIGRGTRLFDGKFYFTIYDFVGASELFQDEEWDGDPSCPVCGNYPCSCNKGVEKPHDPCPNCGQYKCICPRPLPEPCPVCGHLPCTCPAEDQPKKTIEVKLSHHHKVMLYTEWEERVQFGDELITVEDLLRRLFGQIPKFFNGEDDLRTRWAHPETREALLLRLEEEGYVEDKLDMLRKVLKMEDCDLLDVLLHIAYEQPAFTREKRVAAVQQYYISGLTKQQQSFDNLILDYYSRNGFKELNMNNLKTFIGLQYGSMADAKAALQMTPVDIRAMFIKLQHELYAAQGAAQLHLHIGGNLIMHSDNTINNNF